MIRYFWIVIFGLVFCVGCNMQKEQKMYHRNGTLRTVGMMKDELKEGIWKRFDDSGQLLWTATYTGGKLNGIVTTYFDRKELQENKMSINLLGSKAFDEEVKLYRETIEPYVLDKRHGLVIRYFQNGDYREENYVEGKLHGDFKTYYKNGVLAIHGVSENDTIVGEYKKYYETGELLEIGQHKDNKAHGIWKGFHKNGAPYYTMLKEKGKKIGKVKYTYEDGTTKAIFNYVDNLMDGEWVWYHPNGKLEQKRVYDMNTDVRSEDYNADGRLIRKRIYEEGKLVSDTEY